MKSALAGRLRGCCWRMLRAGAAAAPAFAQETGDAPPPEPTLPAAVEGAKTFLPADFTRFAPRNALDMLRNVPGFTIREATQERGLGTATGNVLINGQRISGKSNDVLTELGRIPASNVTRIEIVDAATLNVPGLSGQIANVFVKADSDAAASSPGVRNSASATPNRCSPAARCR